MFKRNIKTRNNTLYSNGNVSSTNFAIKNIYRILVHKKQLPIICYIRYNTFL